MKRFSIFCAALFAAVTSFAAVNYELNGGVTNADNWMSKGDMWTAFSADAGISVGTLDEVKANGDPYTLICGKLAEANVTTIMGIEKWDWLEEYVMEVQNADLTTPATQLTAGTASTGWRYALAAFFLESQRTGWPKSADFSSAGKPEAFIPAWKHAFANPTEPTGEWVLNAPYKEGDSFLGWYWNADFSGEKVTKIDATSTGTLYAKFGEYIPTVAEVKALADDTETKVSGVVNFISGKNIYIQDATGGILVYVSEEPTCKVGDNIVAKGKKVLYGGAPEVKSAVIESAEAGELASATSFENLATLVADTLFKHFATRVSVPGVKIVSYDSYKNPTVEDDLGNKAVCYKMSLDTVKFPLGTKVTVTAVAGWFNGFQFVGDVAGIVRPVVGKVEDYIYEERSNGRFTLENNWVISNVEDNYAANKPGSNDYVRGMAAKDGIMYFINRETASIVRVDGATGDMLDPITLKGEHLFEKPSVDETTGDTTWAGATTLPFNDIKFDQAGNCLIGACISASTYCQPFFIYLVDLETGECKEIVNDVIWDQEDYKDYKFRFDAFGVAGDVTKKGVIMAAEASADGYGSLAVWRWLIEDTVAVTKAQQVPIKINAATDQSLFITETNFGTAPQVFPQDEAGELFYVDGFNQLPMLFYGNPETGAMLYDDFINVPSGTKVYNSETDVMTMNYGHNGLVEFQVGDEYFLLMAATNTAGSPASSFALFRFADADRAFSGMEPLWYFPHKGMGSLTNGCRTAVPSVDVVSDTEATLYLYTNNNGYAAYTLKIDPTIDYESSLPVTSIEEVGTVEIGVRKVLDNGQIFIIKNGLKYNVLGASVK